MLLLPAYAVFVWYCCFRWRRRFAGLAALCFGEAIILTLLWIEQRFRNAPGARDHASFSNLSLLLAGEGLIVAAMGFFLWALPRTRAEFPCRSCGYELLGLESDAPICPECGTAALTSATIHTQPPRATQASAGPAPGPSAGARADVGPEVSPSAPPGPWRSAR